MTDQQALADRCHTAAGPSRALNGELFRTLARREDDEWSDAFTDDVWHRRDREDAAAWDAPPPLTSDTDAAHVQGGRRGAAVAAPARARRRQPQRHRLA